MTFIKKLVGALGGLDPDGRHGLIGSRPATHQQISPRLLDPRPIKNQPTQMPGQQPSHNPYDTRGVGSAFQNLQKFARDNPAAMAVLGANIAGGNTARGFEQFGLLTQANRKRSATTDLLERESPELAQAVRDGLLTGRDAYGMHLRNRSQTNKMDKYGFNRTGAMSQKVKALQMQGIDEETALGIASNRYRVSVNPLNGERVLVDVANQELVPLRRPTTAQPSNQQPETKPSKPASTADGTLYGMVDDATGLSASVRSGLSNTIGQVPGPIGEIAQSPDVARANQAFQLFAREMIRSLSLNPKFPVAEQQRLENLVPRGATVAPHTLQTSLIELDQEFDRIQAEAQARLSDPNTPIQQLQADQNTIQFVRSAKQRLGVPRPEDRRDATGVPGGDNSAEVNALVDKWAD